MNGGKSVWVRRWTGSLIAAATFAVYVCTLSRGAYPGDSARLISLHSDLLPLTAPTHSVWGILVRAVAWIPLGSLAARLNVASALCGAAAVGALFVFVRSSLSLALACGERDRPQDDMAAWLGGVSSSLFLAFSVPFWTVSTRAHVASLDVLILLALSCLFLTYVRTGSTRVLLGFCFAYVAATVEFATLIVLAPVFGVLVFLGMFSWEQCKTRNVFQVVAACSAAGLATYLLAALGYRATPGYAASQCRGIGDALVALCRDHYMLIARSLPREGWLIVLFVSVLPWLVALMSARGSLDANGKEWGYYLLHGVMTGVVLLVLFNARCAPWRMLGAQQVLVTPYVLTACVFGYLVANGFLLPTTWWPFTENRTRIRARQILAWTFASTGLAAGCAGAVLNAREADGRHAEAVNRLANMVMDSLTDRTWLVTDGSIDDHLLIAARDRGIPLRLLSLGMAKSNVYMRHVAGMFDAPAYRNLARVGMLPLIEEWLTREPEIERKAAVMGLPDLWASAGKTAIPNRLLFLGAPGTANVDPERLVREHESFWAAVMALGPVPPEDIRPPWLRTASEYLRRQAAFAANNLGVLMEDLNRPDLAVRCYGSARSLDPTNVSALLNLMVMTEHGHAQGMRDAVKKDMAQLLGNLKGKHQIWSLSRYYGTVRMPQAFAQMGMAWAYSGRPGLAISGLVKAMELLPGDRQRDVKAALASLYLTQDEPAQGEAIYAEMLKANPSDKVALIGMARAAANKEEFARADECLNRAEAAGVDRVAVAIERARVRALAGDLGQARILLQEVVDLHPEQARAWEMLVGVVVSQKDEAGLAQCVTRLEQSGDGKGALLPFARGHLALMRGAWPDAGRHFRQAQALKPGNVRIQEAVLRLDLLQGLQTATELDAVRLLQMDPRNGLGNHVMGSIQMARGEYELAEDSLRRSMGAARTPSLLNDMAWLLQVQSRLAEAEIMAREAVAKDDSLASAWDTLGVILMKSDRLDEAGKAIGRSLSLAQHPSAMIHMADLHARQGDRVQLKAVVESLLKIKNRLSAKDQDRLEEIVRAMGGTGG